MADYRDDPAHRSTRTDAVTGADRRTGVAGTDKTTAATSGRHDRNRTDTRRREGGRSNAGRTAGALAAVALAVLLVAWLAGDLFDGSDDALTEGTAVEESETVETGTEAEPLTLEETESEAGVVAE